MPSLHVPWLVLQGPAEVRCRAASLRERLAYRVMTVPIAGRTALEAVLQAGPPPVIVVDVAVCEHIGLDAVHALRRQFPATRWVLCGAAPLQSWLPAFMGTGARGAVASNVDGPGLARALDAVRAGELWLPRAAARWMHDALYSGATSMNDPGAHEVRPAMAGELTPREAQAMELLRQGLTNGSIALRMGVSVNTVKKHLGSAFGKLGIRTRRQVCAGEWPATSS